MLDPRLVFDTPAHTAEERRRLEAMLRWRVRWATHHLGHKKYVGARLFPVLLHASFPRTPLQNEAPGVSGLRYRPSWSRWTRAMELPPPARAQRGPSLVDAVLGIPTPNGVELQVLVPRGLRDEDLSLLKERLQSAQVVVNSAGGHVQAELYDSGRLAREPLAALRALLFGALLGGRITAPCWQAIEVAGYGPVTAEQIAALMESAPGSMAQLALALLGAGAPSGPLLPLIQFLQEGVPARLMADPAILLSVWAGRETGHRDSIRQVLHLTSSPSIPHAPVQAALDLGSLVRLGHSLFRASAAAAHQSKLCGPARQVWRKAMGPGFPRVLLPVLGQRLLEQSKGSGLSLVPVQKGEGFAVHLPDGTLLARGSTPAQARVRAIALVAEAGGEQLVSKADPAWGPVAGRLAKARPRPTLLLLVEPAGGVGPPFDPLNRGPNRELAIAGALAIRLKPGRAPSARVLTAEETVLQAMQAPLTGIDLEVVPGRTEARPVSARLAQIAGLLRDSSTPELALQVGGAVYRPRGSSLSRYSLERFLARPRRVSPDPDAPDLALLPGEHKRSRWTPAGLIPCRLSLLTEETVSVLYADGAGNQLRERVALAILEEHLRDARSVIQAADPNSALALHFSEDVEPALRRALPLGPRLAIAVSGELPFDLVLHVGSEQFETRKPNGWSTAAQAILSHWPLHAEGHLAVNSVTVRHAGADVKGLLALYVRSMALRRLRTHISRFSFPLSSAEAEPIGQVEASADASPNS